MITPRDTPSAPAEYDAVAVQDMNIQAPQTDISGAFNAANALAGSGVLYPIGPRQSMTETMLSSPQGFAVEGYDIDAGFAAGWDTNVEPGG